jgi:hypothetical protein
MLASARDLGDLDEDVVVLVELQVHAAGVEPLRVSGF